MPQFPFIKFTAHCLVGIGPQDRTSNRLEVVACFGLYLKYQSSSVSSVEMVHEVDIWIRQSGQVHALANEYSAGGCIAPVSFRVEIILTLISSIRSGSVRRRQSGSYVPGEVGCRVGRRCDGPVCGAQNPCIAWVSISSCALRRVKIQEIRKTGYRRVVHDVAWSEFIVCVVCIAYRFYPHLDGMCLKRTQVRFGAEGET